jgi:hypothetical protein
VDKKWEGKFFLGDLPSTIEKHFEHMLDAEKWYVSRIGGNIIPENDMVKGREKITDFIIKKYKNENIKIYDIDQQEWTIRKVIRRFIWHDRFHAKAIEDMEKRLNKNNI